MGTELTRAVISGILTGGVYALMAAGLTLIFGVMEIINIAQGIFVVLAAYLSYTLQVHLGIDPFLGLLVTMPLMFGVGLLVEWGFVRRLKPQNHSALSILVTFAVAIVIEGILTQLFSADLKTLTAWYVDKSLHVLGFFLPYIYLLGFALAAVLLLALYLFLYRSRTGKSIRASVQNRTGAELIGININRVSAITFGVGAAVTAAGGMVFGATNSFNPNSGYDLISRLLVIIVLGGLGSIGGALVAAVVALVIEDVTAVLWSPVWASTMFFAVLVVVLLVRPNGLFGRQEARAQ
ncbi:MAG TPA: branched-chain amino acid ABC transporter permease [Pseudonocardiaceae bacterium]|nr:branched-chain amino acid ABC transporter permease [Pseudonocardiaceae bacterium]